MQILVDPMQILANPVQMLAFLSKVSAAAQNDFWALARPHPATTKYVLSKKLIYVSTPL